MYIDKIKNKGYMEKKTGKRIEYRIVIFLNRSVSNDIDDAQNDKYS